MNPTETTVPAPSPSPSPLGPRLSSLASTLLANRYVLPAITIVLGFLLGIGLMAAVTPKPIDPATYTKPLQAQQLSLKQQQAYARIIAIDYPLVVLNENLLANDCTNNLLSSCQTDAGLVAKDAGQFETDLKAITVPTCLSHVHQLFLTALHESVDGATAVKGVLASNSTANLSAASATYTKGFNDLDAAMTAYKAVNC